MHFTMTGQVLLFVVDLSEFSLYTLQGPSIQYHMQAFFTKFDQWTLLVSYLPGYRNTYPLASAGTSCVKQNFVTFFVLRSSSYFVVFTLVFDILSA